MRPSKIWYAKVLPKTYHESIILFNIWLVVEFRRPGVHPTNFDDGLDDLDRVTSALNSPGPQQGSVVRPLRALDRTGRQNAVRSRPGILRRAVIAKDGEPYNLRQISVGGYGGRRRTTEDYRVNFLRPLNNFVCQVGVGICAKIIEARYHIPTTRANLTTRLNRL